METIKNIKVIYQALSKFSMMTFNIEECSEEARKVVYRYGLLLENLIEKTNYSIAEPIYLEFKDNLKAVKLRRIQIHTKM